MTNTPRIEPTREELRKLHDALVAQLPALAPDWWRRVKRAVKDQSEARLALLKAEAENRLDHETDRRVSDVLDVLFRLLGLMVSA